MNREIKFRGFQKSWIYGGISIFQNEATIFDINCIANSAYEVDINSVGQFTGFKDFEGKEIYEGDILFHNLQGNRKVYYPFNQDSAIYGMENLENGMKSYLVNSHLYELR